MLLQVKAIQYSVHDNIHEFVWSSSMEISQGVEYVNNSTNPFNVLIVLE